MSLARPSAGIVIPSSDVGENRFCSATSNSGHPEHAGAARPQFARQAPVNLHRQPRISLRSLRATG
jgi:hypothetical protein